MIDIDETLKELSGERPIFHSEADFQHALAWKIHEKNLGLNVRLERRIELNEREIYVDIYIFNELSTYLIEVKYKTKEIELEYYNEKFRLKNQSAQDVSRYDFIKDISRLEECVEKLENAYGCAIFLTNDPSYWKEGRAETKDKDFRIHGEKVLEGELKWKEGTSEGTMKGREEPITLKGEYKLEWKNYSDLSGNKPEKKKKNDKFKYLLVEIDPQAFKKLGCVTSLV